MNKLYIIHIIIDKSRDFNTSFGILEAAILSEGGVTGLWLSPGM